MPGLMIDPRDPRFRALPRTMRTIAPPPSMSIPQASDQQAGGQQPLPPPMDIPPGPPAHQAPSAGYNPLYSMQQQQPVDPPVYEEPMPPPEEKWSASGKTDSFGSFFNKRSSTDALTAFGAAMLKAPTFMQGLGDAALAVNAVDRENRMPTEEEIAKANIKARIAAGKGAFAPKAIAHGFDTKNSFWTGSMEDGAEKWRSDTGAVLDHAPPGFVPSSQSGAAKNSNLQVVDIDTDYELAQTAQTNIEDYNEMERLIPTASTGPDLWSKSLRFMNAISGRDFEGSKLSDIQEYTKISKNGELLKAMESRGLGQFTDTERKIVQEALVTIDTTPEAARNILAVMKARAQRNIEVVDDWNASGLAPNQYRSWKRKWMKNWEEENESVYSALHKESSTQEGAPASILDEADAIVN